MSHNSHDATTQSGALATKPAVLRHINQIDLSRRWNISPRTLERWRWLRQGPEYLKIGGRIVYRLADVEAFEAAKLCRPASNQNASNQKPK